MTIHDNTRELVRGRPEVRAALGGEYRRTDFRREQARRFALQLGLDPAALYRAADAVWSNLNPDRYNFENALSIAGVALRAAEQGETDDVEPGDALEEAEA